MPTYLYETISTHDGPEPERFEFHQSMKDEAFTHHPETGQPIRRVLTGGFGLMKVRSRGFATSPPHSAQGTDCCPGCHD